MGIHTGNKTTGNTSSLGNYDTKGASFLLATTPADDADNSQLFVDSSSNDFVVTRNGDAVRSSANPYVPNGYWSAQFNGTGDYLTLASNDAFRTDQGDWTIECWVFPNTSSQLTVATRGVYLSSHAFYAGTSPTNNGALVFEAGTGGWAAAATYTSTANAVIPNQWNHIAYVRSGTNFFMYANGVRVFSQASALFGSNVTAPIYIGTYYNVSASLNGYMSNFRMVKGTALYTAATYTISTSPLTVVANTSILTCQDNRFVDESGNNFAITRSGAAAVVATSPFTRFRSYNPGISGGSVLLDGTGDYLTVPQNSALNFGTGAFTVEAWVYLTAYPSGGNTAILSLGDGAYGISPFVYSGWSLVVSSTGTAIWYRYDGTETNYSTSNTIPLNQWVHVVAVRNASSNLSVYINGSRGYNNASASVSYNNVNTNPLNIGAWYSGATPITRYLTGYISNARVVTGTAVYDPTLTTITVPTSPLTAITNTSLLLSYDEKSNTFIDSSLNNFAITKNADATQSALSPYVPSGWWSGQFDGNGDYLSAPSNAAFAFGTGDLTVEYWIYSSSFATGPTVFDTRTSAGSVNGYSDYFTTNGAFNLFFGNTIVYTSSTTIPLNTWTHIAVSRAGTSLRVFIDGTQSGSVVVNSTNFSNSNLLIGVNVNLASFFNGYISNLRVIKGAALYTTNFTPSTTPLTAVSGTSLLCLQDNRFIDRSTNNFAITRNGDAKISDASPFKYTSGYSPLTYYTGYAPGGAGSSSFNGGFLTVANNAAFDFGSGNFTIEMWVYSSTSLNGGIIGKRANTVSAFGPFQIGASANSLSFLISFTGSSWGINATSSTAPQIGAWNHIALTRNGSAFTLWLNGLSVASGSNASALMTNTTSLIIGAGATDGSGPFTGNIAGVRLVKGTSLYNASFTPPTNTLTAVLGTSLLLNFNSARTGTNSTFKDSSVNNFTVTRNGDATTASFNPFTPTGYWSGYFDGNGDYLTNANTTISNFGLGSYTVECFFYRQSSGVGTIIYDGRPTTSNGAYFAFGVDANNKANIFVNTATLVASNATIAVNTWYHIAFVRTGTGTNQSAIYINGVLDKNYTDAVNYANGYNVIGAVAYTPVGAAPYTGYVSNLRIVKGTAVYTSNFTPSTTPLTAIANTSLLCLQDARFIDRSTNNFALTRNGEAKVTQFAPFNVPSGALSTYSGSAYFDGTGDYLSVSSPPVSLREWWTTDYTVEAWVYPTSFTGWWTSSGATAIPSLIGNMDATGGFNYWSFGIASTTGQVRLYYFTGTAQYGTLSTSTVVLNQWNHIALTKTSSGYQYWVNGVGSSVFAISGTPQSASTTNLTIGAYNNTAISGYVSNARIVRGTAVYTTNFTPPTAPLSPTVSAADPYFGYNSLLLTTNNTSGAQNNTFLDSSANNFTITRNGDTTQGSFTPYMPTGHWSGYFPLTSADYLQFPAGSAFAPGTGDFTLEAWIYTASNTDSYIWTQTVSGTNYFLLGFNTTAYFYMTLSGGGTPINGPANSIVLNAWNHIAVTRSSGTVRVFVNGVSGTATNNTTDLSNVSYVPTVGRYAHTTSFGIWTGYISNLRYVKGTAVYTGNFTPPTTPLTAITDTSLLCLQDNRFIDRSSNNFTITRNGVARISKFAPFNLPAPWSASTYGGSGYFDGTGDYLTIADNAVLDLGNSDFCIEGFVYLNSLPASTAKYAIAGKWGASVGNLGYLAQIFNDSGTIKITFEYSTDGSAIAGTFTATATPTANTWNHIAFTRSGSTFRIFLNGVEVLSGTLSATIFDANSSLFIGSNSGTSNYINGYVSNFRLVKGSAVYTGNFTPPTTPLTAITNTSLLLNFTNAGIYDATTINDIETEGNAQASTTQAKFGTTSMYFAAVGDRIPIVDKPELRLGTAPFTIEGWFYLDGSIPPVSLLGKGTSTTGWYIGIDGSGYLIFTHGSTTITGSTSVVSISTWMHFAVVRTGTGTNQTSLYLNGVLVGQGTVATNFNQTNPLYVGDNRTASDALLGYLDELRITNGYARYTANFTAPTSSIVDATSTPLLLKLNDAKVFDATNNTAITTIGDAKVITGRTKYGPTSVAFDGTGDYLTIKDTQSLVLGASDFTIEFWMYPTDVSATVNLFDTRPLTTSGLYPAVYISAGTVRYLVSAVDRITSSAITANSWYHVALVRKNSVTSLFIDGQISGSPYADTNNYLASSICAIGASSYHLDGTGAFKGYIQDLKVTRGAAKYGSFTVPASELTPVQNTTLLLKTGSTNGVQNATFVDSSTNNFTVTRNGDAIQTSFNPHIPNGYWGGYFGTSTTDNLKFASNAAFGIGTGNFTVEFFLNLTAWTGNQRYFVVGVSGTDGIMIGRDSAANNLLVNISSTGATNVITYPWSPNVNQWYHIALVRSGTGSNQVVLYINGVAVATGTSAVSVAQNPAYVGGLDWAASYNTQGYISNARFSNIVRSISVPTTPYISDANTIFLTCQDNRFIDRSANNFTITRNGDAKVVNFDPFTPPTYTPATYGGSGYFDGNGDYLQTPVTASLAANSTDYTAEAWVYLAMGTYAGFDSSGRTIMSDMGSGTPGRWTLGIGSTGYLGCAEQDSGGTNTAAIDDTVLFPLNQWVHVAVAKRGTTLYLFKNGNLVNSVASSVRTGREGRINIGAFHVESTSFKGWFLGYIASARLVVGSALYTSSFVPSSGPLNAIPGSTNLLLNFANAGVYDGVTGSDVTAAGNAQASTTQARFGTTSMYFDGTGDYLIAQIKPELRFGAGNFTVECWVHPTASPNQPVIAGQWSGSTGSTTLSWVLLLSNNSSRNLRFALSTDGANVLTDTISSASLPLNTWSHVALVRNGSVFTLYLDGVGVAGGSYTITAGAALFNATNQISIGASSAGTQPFQGYIDDLRVVNGRALYTTSFTPPTRSLTTLQGS